LAARPVQQQRRKQLPKNLQGDPFQLAAASALLTMKMLRQAS
jgi:hypothetical protein